MKTKKLPELFKLDEDGGVDIKNPMALFLYSRENRIKFNQLVDFLSEEVEGEGGCCEKCYESFGGGATMLPQINKCKNTDCECHKPTPQKPKEDGGNGGGGRPEKPSWESEFDERFGEKHHIIYTNGEEKWRYALTGKEKEIKSFISQTREEAKAEVVEDLDKWLWDNGITDKKSAQALQRKLRSLLKN